MQSKANFGTKNPEENKTNAEADKEEAYKDI